MTFPARCSQKTILLAATIALAASLLSGCQTPPSDEESEIPWNTPQDWESSPMLPGFDGNR